MAVVTENFDGRVLPTQPTPPISSTHPPPQNEIWSTTLEDPQDNATCAGEMIELRSVEVAFSQQPRFVTRQRAQA
jgi:hypothetical protein